MTDTTYAPGPRWLALAFGLVFLVVPDFCLNGRHGHAAMVGYGPICRALR
jgi:hypothetical protein